MKTCRMTLQLVAWLTVVAVAAAGGTPLAAAEPELLQPVGAAVAVPYLAHEFPYKGIPGRMLVESDERIYLEAGNALYCFDVKEMRQVWRVEGVLSAGCQRAGRDMFMVVTGVHLDACKRYRDAAPSGHILPVMSTDGQLLGLRKTDGRKLWDFDPPNTQKYADRFVVDDGTVYAVFGDTLYALSASRGKKLWDEPLQVNGKVPHSLAAPAVCGNYVCVGPLAIGTRSKKVAWTYGRAFNSFLGDVVADDDTFYFSTNHHQNDLCALDARSGQQRWVFSRARAEVPMGIMPAPALCGDRVIVAYHDKEAGGPSTLYALDRKTGKQLWSLPLRAVVPCPAEAAGDVVYCYTWDKTVEIVDAREGKLLGSFKPELKAAEVDGMEGGPIGMFRSRRGGQDVAYLAAVSGLLLAPLGPEAGRGAGGQMASRSTKFDEDGLGLRVYACARYNRRTAMAALAGKVEEQLKGDEALLKYARDEKLADNPHYAVELLQHVDPTVARAACQWLQAKYEKDFGFSKARTDAQKLAAIKQWQSLLNSSKS